MARLQKLLIINGASGSGKTSLAKALSQRLHDARLVHPDGFLDTPEMSAETILDVSLGRVADPSAAPLTIIDCQIRPSTMDRILRGHDVESWRAILLTCPEPVRARRLQLRGWNDDFEPINRWADLLLDESIAAGHTVLDTSIESTGEICAGLVNGLHAWLFPAPRQR